MAGQRRARRGGRARAAGDGSLFDGIRAGVRSHGSSGGRTRPRHRGTPDPAAERPIRFAVPVATPPKDPLTGFVEALAKWKARMDFAESMKMLTAAERQEGRDVGRRGRAGDLHVEYEILR